jgi:hypothetical protein
MKILAIADLHGNLQALQDAMKFARAEQCDVLACAGDLEDGRIARELASSDLNIVAVAGNMDRGDIAEHLGNTCIHGKMVKIGGVDFFGISGPESAIGDGKEFHAEIEKSAPKKFVLLTHHPPKGVKTDVTYIRTHIGSNAVREIIEKFSPVLCIHGHVHEARGTDRIGSTVIVNPGPGYKKDAAVIHLDKVVDVELIKI